MRISFRGAPGASPLFLDYLDAWPLLHRYYSSYYSPEAIADFAQKRSRPDATHLNRLCTTLAEQHQRWGASLRGVEKLGAGAVAVITGQQPGLFTGPIFSIYKAITAIKLARYLEEVGIPAIPVFWVAAEDHDHAEISSTFVLNKDSNIDEFQISLSGHEAAPVGWTSYGDDVTTALESCFQALPQSEFLEEVKSVWKNAYRPGVSPVDAFTQTMVKLLSGYDIVFVDPLHPELKELAKPTLIDVVKENETIRSAVMKRSQELVGAGYHAQVKVDQNFTGLFRYNGQARQPMKPWDLAADMTLSPNALLRPVMQDTLFPTAAYVGGPAEIAYFAQSKPAYDALRRPMPPVFPRISATLVEPRIKRGLQKYKLDFVDVFRGPDGLKRAAVESVQDGAAFDRVREGVASLVESLDSTLQAVDPTLLSASQTSQRKMLYQIERLRTRFLNAEARRNQELERHVNAIANSLYPHKKLQERVLNVTSFLVRYGFGLVGRLDRQLDIDSTEHQIIDIE